MGIPGGMELILLLAMILLLFGAKRIPDLAKSLGSGIREFRKGATPGEMEAREEDENVGTAGHAEPKT